MAKGEGGECKKSCVPKHKIVNYWDFRYPRNMLRRVQRLHRRLLHFWAYEEFAREASRRCASAHGPQVEGAVSRWLRGEKPFSS